MAKKPLRKTAPVVKAEKAVEVKPEVKAEVKPEAKLAEEKKEKAKVEEAKVEEAAKEVVKEAAEVVKETAKEATAAVKETAQKAVKKAATAKKTAKEKAVLQPEVFVQYEDNGVQEANIADVVAKIKALYVAEGHRESSIKSLRVYMKPQEWKAYYVINDKISGEIQIF